MIGRVKGYWALCLAVLLIVGCGKSPEKKAAEETAKQGAGGFGDAGEKMGGSMTAGTEVEAVDFRELKALLPDSLPGMKRTDSAGQRTTAFGIKVSTAEGTYRNERGGTINIKITDMGSLKALTAIVAFGWAVVEIDRETDTGYEKTTTFAGHRAHEQYDKRGRTGELQVLVADRFVVEVEGHDVTIDVVKDALGKIDLRKLEGMQTKGLRS